MVFVLNKNGKPLMPTNRHGKVRRMLKDGRAKVVKRTPFTIQLLYDSENYVQPISLGVDAGSKHVGISATTEKNVLFEADVELRNDVVDNLSTRREVRRTRRNRKTRYRKPRFKNRVKSKKSGWLAPSVKQKIDTHLNIIAKVHKILPISNIVVEVASFDIQKIKNPEISGKEYQEGDQVNSWNVREYVLSRDNHTCQCCKGKSKDNVLQVHHVESRKTGGDAPNNLITLCKTCHENFHKGKIDLPKSIQRGKSFRDASFMGIMHWAFYEKLKEIYENVTITFGYITKNCRITHKLPKEHYIDARCISGNPEAKSDNIVYFFRKIRCHNRQIHKSKVRKGEQMRRKNQLTYETFGFRLFDKVYFDGKECFITGRRESGSFALKDIFYNNISGGKSYKKLRFLEPSQGFMCQRVQI